MRKKSRKVRSLRALRRELGGTKKIRGFSTKKKDGTVYNNELERWPSSRLGTFRHEDQKG